MCNIDPNIGEVWWHGKKMELEKSSLIKKKKWLFFCKKPKNKFYSLDFLGFKNVNIYFLRFFEILHKWVQKWLKVMMFHKMLDNSPFSEFFYLIFIPLPDVSEKGLNLHI